tara:strand:+ start:4908 stop:5084 length:177 start_codon:yes stop_codon:yes gene_type:complete
MSLHRALEKQAAEHSKLEAEIMDNVANRKWTREQLQKKIAYLYIMGIKHGIENAIERG